MSSSRKEKKSLERGMGKRGRAGVINRYGAVIRSYGGVGVRTRRRTMLIWKKGRGWKVSEKKRGGRSIRL